MVEDTGLVAELTQQPDVLVEHPGAPARRGMIGNEIEDHGDGFAARRDAASAPSG
jgi:hypothetical protein